MVVLPVVPLVLDPLPGVCLHPDGGPVHPAVRLEEVVGQEEGEGLGAGDAVALGQQVHRVLLRVRSDDVGVVALVVRKEGWFYRRVR